MFRVTQIKVHQKHNFNKESVIDLIEIIQDQNSQYKNFASIDANWTAKAEINPKYNQQQSRL